jgi:hypothetical protein
MKRRKAMNASVRMKHLASATALQAAGAKGRKKLVTIEELAATPFDAWKPDEDGWKPPADSQDWVKQLTECIPTLVLAFAVLGRDKQYLMSMCDKIDDQMYRDFVDNIGVWQGYFEGLASLLSTAETRLMVALSANVVKRDEKKRTRRKAA